MENEEKVKLQRKVGELTELEDKLKLIFKEEIKNIFHIGATLSQIRDRKLYYYKDTDGNYTWDMWCREFMGSKATANRYILLYHTFIVYYKYKSEELEDIHYTKLLCLTPLLTSGEIKNKDDVDELVERARTAPSLSELKKGLIQKDMSLDDIAQCSHILDYYVQCRICGERRIIKKSNIINSKEIEDKF